MKVAIIALGLFVLVAMVKAESCSMASDCQNLKCAGNERCESGLCTCQAQNANQGDVDSHKITDEFEIRPDPTTDYSQNPDHGLLRCVTASDCAKSPMMQQGHCRANSMHCVDGHCRCFHN